MSPPPMSDDVRDLALPLREAADLDPLLDRIGDARVVLLGDTSALRPLHLEPERSGAQDTWPCAR